MEERREELDRSLWVVVGYRWLSYVDLVGNIGFVVVVLITVFASVAVGVKVNGWLGGILGFGLVVASFAIAGANVLRDRTSWLREIFERPDLTVELGPEMEVAEAPWTMRMVRVMVQNNSDLPRLLVAKTADLTGLVGSRPEVPWPVRWRHEKSREHRLFPQDQEMLDVAGIRHFDSRGNPVDDHPTLRVFVAGDHGAGDVLVQDDDISIRVKVWDADGGQLAADFTVTIPVPHLTADISIASHEIPEPR